MKCLNIGIPVIYRLASEGKIPGTKDGKQGRFRKEKSNEWMDQGGKVSFRRNNKIK